MIHDTDESLTLDVDARTRAMQTLGLNMAVEDFYLHRCVDWDEGDGCSVCWEVAAEIIRAAENLRLCKPCGGTGNVGHDAHICCDDCGGNGLALRDQATAPQGQERGDE